jgi:hypothetical protein
VLDVAVAVKLAHGNGGPPSTRSTERVLNEARVAAQSPAAATTRRTHDFGF